MNTQGFQTIVRIACHEWRVMWRRRVTLAAIVMLLLLTVIATVVSLQQTAFVERERARFQHTADQHWDAQPDRHPHRVVHYGHFVFRPLQALSFFDFGVDPYTGRALYLEGHRQNSANFSDARQSSLLLRFGQLTPAFVLQTLAPLLIVFLVFGSVAREREDGQLRLALCQGASGASILSGKIVGHAAVAFLLAAPAFAVLAFIGLSSGASALKALLMAVGYSFYLLIWVVLSVVFSASVSRARDALLGLVGLWILTVILLPRVLPEIASARIVLPTKIETDAAIHKELAAIGDSHNPDDPYFGDFRKRVLKQYGVTSVDSLPVNYGGLLMAEGERLTSDLFDRHMRESFARQAAQRGFVNRFTVVSPVLALRQLSTALAGTSLEDHHHFLSQAEKYRFSLIQALNTVHANEVRYENDRAQRVSRDHWQHLPRFHFEPVSAQKTYSTAVLPGLAMLGAWAGMLLLIAARTAKRITRAGK